MLLKYTGTNSHYLTFGWARNVFKKRFNWLLLYSKKFASRLPKNFFFGKLGVPSELSIFFLIRA